MIGDALKWAVARLSEARFESPDVEARVLLGAILQCSPTTLLLHADEVLDEELLSEYKLSVARRLKGEPAAYITGRKNFMGFEFEVDSRVLIPRPETELLVEDILMEVRDLTINNPRILDVGTGSGCIAISLACLTSKATKEVPEIYACDISLEALDLAKKNALQHEVSIEFFQSDLLKNVPPDLKGGFDMIAANLPYIHPSILPRLQPEISFEPRLALEGGEGGITLIKRLIQESFEFLKPHGLLELEIGYDQGDEVRGILERNGFEQITILKDYGGHDRIAKGRKSGPI
ncbi:MAG: Release factor glutamine methyltransferase [Elusimicrobia bacterium]|nr:Release factor glutamine methyltransferase [Elusimicrobiota bacterium]